MSDPTPPKAQPHHGKRTWTSYWRTPAGAAKSKRFGRVGEVSRTEAAAAFKAWLANEYPTLAASQAAKYPVDVLCEEYFEVVKKRYVRGGKYTASLNRYKVALESFGAAYGHLESDEVSPANVAEWLEGFIKTKRKRAPGKGAKTCETVNLALTCIKRMFRWGMKMGKVSAAAAGGVRVVENVGGDHPDVRHTEPKTGVAWEVVERTLAKCDPALADMIRVQWHTGMRPGEVVSMKAMELTVKGDVTLYQPPWHKTAWRGKKSVRVIALGPKSMEVVAKYVSTKPAEPMFRCPDGRAYTSKSYRAAIHRACRDAEVSVWNPNQIRHSYTTRVREQFGELGVAAMLGHANLNQQRVYGEMSVKREVG
jgi:integrase